MLNANTILNYLKQNLGYPWSVLEMTDSEIIKYIQEFVLKDFSLYLPDKKKIGYDFNDVNNKTNIPNEYYLYDPEGCEILNLIEIIFSLSSDVAVGHPVVGILSYDEVTTYLYNAEKARTADLYSMLDMTYEFISPNIVRVEPEPDCTAVIVYERVHPGDFTTIPTFAHMIFLNFCLGHLMLVLGRKRKKYQNIQTPYGEVPLNADEIKSEGQDIIEKIKDDLKMYNPGVIIDTDG